jgi:hypothetical protein
MSNDVRIDGSGKTAKIRNPWLVLLFTLITFNIYSIFWWYFVNREMVDLGKARKTGDLGDSPGTSTAAYTIGSIVYVPWFWTVITTNRRVQRAQEMTVGKSLNGWLAAAVWILTLTLGGPVYLQYELNKVWRAPGMTPTDYDEHPDEAGDAERTKKLSDLEKSGALSAGEVASERHRLGLAG